jgi:hypothetical protein
MWEGLIYCTICEQDNVEISLVLFKIFFFKAAVRKLYDISISVSEAVIGKLWEVLIFPQQR